MLKLQNKNNKIIQTKSNNSDKTVILKPKDIERKPAKKKKKGWIIGGAIALFILIGVIGNLNSSENDKSKNNVVSTAQTTVDQNSTKKTSAEAQPVKTSVNYDKDVYEGYVKDSKKVQQGKYTWENGDVYEGTWKDNKMDGKGLLKKANGDNYNGDFANNKEYGSGIYTWANSETYEGSFENDLMNGKGVYHFKNGDVYDGEWVNNKMSGEGKYTYKNGQVQQGTWENNKLKK